MAAHVALPFEERLLLQLAYESLFESGGRWPVFQYLDLEGVKEGIAVPHRCLKGIEAGLIRYEPPLRGATSCRLSVRGIISADPSAAVVHRGFLQVVRGLSDRWGREELLSPAEPQPVLVPARDLWQPNFGSPTDLRIVGLLLEEESIGSIEWTADPESPFSVLIDYDIRKLGGAVNIHDYFRIRDSED